MVGVCHAFASVHCCLVVACWERSDPLALVCDVLLCCVTFPCGIQCQVWYLIVLIPDLCRLSYFELNWPSGIRIDGTDEGDKLTWWANK